ncbi:hypothetical protein CYMTET_21400, partial [Cymbomonas tetramitiformis]
MIRSAVFLPAIALGLLVCLPRESNVGVTFNRASELPVRIRGASDLPAHFREGFSDFAHPQDLTGNLAARSEGVLAAELLDSCCADKGMPTGMALSSLGQSIHYRTSPTSVASGCNGLLGSC